MFKVYGKDNCRYCKDAKKALEMVGEEFNYIDLKGKDEVREELRQQGFDTIPAIFYNGEVMGGYEQLHEWITAKYF